MGKPQVAHDGDGSSTLRLQHEHVVRVESTVVVSTVAWSPV